VGGNFLAWIEDSMMDRKQRVGINRTCLSWQAVISGESQWGLSYLQSIFMIPMGGGGEREVCKLGDSTELGGKVSCVEHTHR